MRIAEGDILLFGYVEMVNSRAGDGPLAIPSR
jgi:hypothetical protein